MPHNSEAMKSVNQLGDVWKMIVSDLGSGEIKDLPGIKIRWADTRFSFLNTITFNDAGADSKLLSSRLFAASDFMSKSSRHGFVWLFEDLLDPIALAELPALAADAGLELAFSGYSMAGQILPMPEPSHPDLTFIRVTTDAQLHQYADINAVAYGVPVDDVRDGMIGTSLWQEIAHSYIAFAGGVPVSAAAVIESRGSLFLALVATIPDAQRKGYAEAICRKALFEASKATGLTHSDLHATMAGAPVYERIGYRKGARIGFYSRRT